MFKNILVISDNYYISNEIISIWSSKKINSNLTFSISPFSDRNDFSSISNVHVFNLKKSDDVQKIINEYDLIISAHCKQIFPSILVKSVKCINIHPGYNPVNRGWYPQVFSIINDLDIGATIHEIDEELDHGNIIDRAFVDKHIWDTSKSLYDRIVQKELELFDKNIERIIEGDYVSFPIENEGNVFLKNDFKELCIIDMNKTGKFKDFYDHLRALTHGEYKNAFFVDSKSQKKYYLSINITNG